MGGRGDETTCFDSVNSNFALQPLLLSLTGTFVTLMRDFEVLSPTLNPGSVLGTLSLRKNYSKTQRDNFPPEPNLYYYEGT